MRGGEKSKRQQGHQRGGADRKGGFPKGLQGKKTHSKKKNIRHTSRWDRKAGVATKTLWREEGSTHSR